MKHVLLVVALVSAGCAAPDEFHRRFEAERARWEADREHEAVAGRMDAHTYERLRATYDAIERDFGAATRPAASVLADPDARLRLEIAGHSALVRADLAAAETASAEIAAEYARVAEIYGFDPALDHGARVGEARARERLGDEVGALAVWDSLLAAHPKVPAAPATLALADAEIHAAALAGRALGTTASRERRARVRRELMRLADEWGEAPGRRHVARRLADAHLLDERWVDGLGVLAELAAGGGRGEEAAELELAQGAVHEMGTGEFDRAEEHYRRAMSGGDAGPAAAEARLRLADLLRRRGRPREGLVEADSLLGLGARMLVGREAEALWVKARCLVALTRWEDAIPAFARAAGVDPESPYGLAAALERYERFSRLLRVAPSAAAEDLVAVAQAVPAGRPAVPAPRDWHEEARMQRRRSVWRDDVSGLEGLADREGSTALGRAALVQAIRLADERAHRPVQADTLRRKYEKRFPDAGEIKKTASADELSR